MIFAALSDGKDRVQWAKEEGRPRATILCQSADCQTESKALENSMWSKLFGLEAFSFGSRYK